MSTCLPLFSGVNSMSYLPQRCRPCTEILIYPIFQENC